MTSASSRFKSTVVALAALALGATGCGSTNACKSGTLLVTLTFDPATAAATQLVVDVSSPGTSSRQHQLDHQAGMTTGTLEIDFPDGYVAGQTVQITVTASTSGAAIGSATGSVTLASGCSTLTLHFGGSDAGGPAGTGGASGGAGGKSTGGSGGANAGGAGGPGGAAGSIGGTGTGGTGTGGTGTGGTGAGGTGTGGTGAGGAGTGGAGGAACVFKSAEDCFNGIDDDCNGKTDCEDPACTPTTECVAAPGSTFQAGVEAATASTTCPSNFTGGETALDEGLNIPAATSCTGCSCTASTSCSISLYSYSTAAVCNADSTNTGGTLVGTVTNSAMCVQPSGNILSTAPGYRVSNVTQSDSACTPSGTPTIPATSWTTQKKFCAANRLGGGCSPGYVCAPKLAQLTDHCVRADGNLACPAGYSAQTDTWYKGMSDGRACAACSCGAETPGDCSKEQLSGTNYARNLAFWPNSFGQCSTSGGTSFNVSTTPGSKTCCALQCEASSCGATGTACGNFGYDYPPLQASCPPTSAISGAATPTGPETVCCL
jgi:hypothetical protein